MMTNPGIPKDKKHYDINDLNSNYRQCNKCNCIFKKKDTKVNHCEECGICIEGFHRHSFLVNKCIGRKSKILFYIFIAFLIANIIYIVILIGLGNR